MDHVVTWPNSKLDGERGRIVRCEIRHATVCVDKWSIKHWFLHDTLEDALADQDNARHKYGIWQHSIEGRDSHMHFENSFREAMNNFLSLSQHYMQYLRSEERLENCCKETR